MAIPVILPRQGQSVESCIITDWFKHVGDTVKEGEPLFAYETDKSSFEEPAKASGTLLAVFCSVDDDVPCLTNVAVIGDPGEDFSEFAAGGEATAAPAEPAAQATSVMAAVEAIAVAASAGANAADAPRAIGVSPRARMTAERLGVDANAAAPTGPNGRVIERDVFALAQADRNAAPAVQPAQVQAPVQVQAPMAVSAPDESGAPAAAYVDERISNLRKIIGKSMQQSLSTMAQLTHTSSFDASAILSLRKQCKAALAQMELAGVTLNDMVLYACSRVLRNHPDLNAHLLDNTMMRRFSHVHLGMAVDTPRGLLVPTIFDADTKSLKQISQEAKALAKAAQDGSINPDLLTGASFTISNLGAMGIETFTPVINPPQTGILGVCNTIERVRMVDGVVTTYPAMGLSLTYDHRALDGAPASRFLKELCDTLSNFVLYLAC